MRKSKEENRRQIMDAAYPLLKEKGFETVSIMDICKSASVSRSSFYTVFRNREELVSSFFSFSEPQYRGMLSRLLGLTTPYEQFLSAVSIYFDRYAEAGPYLLSEILKINVADYQGIFEDNIHRREVYVTLIEKCQKEGYIENKQPAPDLYLALCSHSVGILYLWCAAKGDFELKETALAQVESILDVLPKYRVYSKNDITLSI